MLFRRFVTYFKKFKHGDLTKIHDPRLHLGHVTEVKYDSFECYAHFSQIRKFTRIAIICLLFMLHNTKKFQEILFHLFLLEKNKSAHSPASQCIRYGFLDAASTEKLTLKPIYVHCLRIAIVFELFYP